MDDHVSNQGPVNCYGPKLTICRAVFTGQAVTAIVLSDALGIRSVVQSATDSGLFTVTLDEKFPAFSARVWINGEAVRLHECVVFGEDYSAGTFQFQHYYSATNRTTTPSVTTAGVLANGSSPACVFHIEVKGRGAM